jgi:hypothetical protein
MGCSFRNRCGHAAPECGVADIEMREIAIDRGFRCIRPLVQP